MAKKASKPGGAPASDQPSKLVYIVCRWWPYLAPEFPFDRFDHLPDDELPNAVEQLRQEVVLQHRAAIEKRRQPSWMSPERGVMSMGPSILYPRGRSGPDTLEDRPPSLVEAFGAMRWVKLSSSKVEISCAGRRSFVEPLPSAVVHATSESRAGAIVELLRSRCTPVEGQYRFAVVFRAALSKPQWIEYERELELLGSAERPRTRSGNPLVPHLVMFGSTDKGVPNWTIPMRDEAQAVEAILDREEVETEQRGADAEHPKPDSGKGRKKGGRPPHPDRSADRRIAEAWATGEHADLTALANALDKTKDEVKKALDRHRKPRAGTGQVDGKTPVEKPPLK